eukprot:s31_g21.t4
MVPKPPEPQALPSVDQQTEKRRSLKRQSCTSLASSIDFELLRAVPAQLVLEGLGKHWSQKSSADDYGLSRRVRAIDVFLSHDWATSRWLKVVTLLVHFNSVPAAVASLLMCVLVCLLIIFELLDGWLTGTIAIHCTYWLVFVFWQQVRGFYKKKMVFLDRLCIAQHDPELKKQGILGLGGFLAKSQRLLVLWSPRYFTRLWTAFELSAFLRHDEAGAKQIDFAPASMGPLLLYFSGFETLLISSFHILVVQFVLTLLGEESVLPEQEGNLSQFTLAMLVICAPAFFVIAPVVLYLGTMQMNALLKLGKQLDSFEIRAANCSCCQVDHCHPETGEELLCDRELVFETLKRWFPDEDFSSANLNKFDSMVRQQLGGFVKSILGSGAPPLQHVIAITVHPLLGFLCHYVYLAVHDYFGWTALGWMIGWLQAPPMVYLAFWEFLQCWRLGARFGDRYPLWLVLSLGMSAGIAFNVAVWLQYNIFKYYFGYDFNWPVLGSLVLMWAALVAEEPELEKPGTLHQLSGTVLSRRVASRKLAFCTLKVDEGQRSGLKSWASASPPGSWKPREAGRRLRRGEATLWWAPVWRRWRRLEDRDEAPSTSPGSYDLSLHLARRDEANRKAREALAAVGKPIALCKFWSGRAAASCGEADCGFRHHFNSPQEEAKASALAAGRRGCEELGKNDSNNISPSYLPLLLLRRRLLLRRLRLLISAAEQSAYDAVADGPHDKAAKPQRAARFAAWLVQTYGKEALCEGSGVLDVAGGQGDLSWALSVEMEVPSTLVDPALRRGGALKSWQRRALRKRGREEAFAHLPVIFEASHFGPEAPGSQAALLANASLVAGLHPDEATEAIVDLALGAGRRFAVVPCCVFAEKFPSRELAPGVPVRTLNQFCAYLCAKDPRIKEALLDFEGRKVLYIL